MNKHHLVFLVNEIQTRVYWSQNRRNNFSTTVSFRQQFSFRQCFFHPRLGCDYNSEGNSSSSQFGFGVLPFSVMLVINIEAHSGKSRVPTQVWNPLDVSNLLLLLYRHQLFLQTESKPKYHLHPEPSTKMLPPT